MNLCMGAILNLYSKIISLILFFLLWSSEASALNTRALYTSACQRKLGLILGVDDQKISFLSFDEGVVYLPRYEIIFMADYPMDVLPTQGKLTIKNIPKVYVSTLNKHKVENLLDGWPIGFNADKISFLTSNGAETVIDSHNIWSLEFKSTDDTVESRKTPDMYRFIHPYAFRECSYGNNKGRDIYPQQILSDPIQIKRELDALQEGFKRVVRYEREQDFYPVPEIYENRTELGMWVSFGSRYGASEKRENNLLPVLVDQYSADVFDYQHYSVTGAAPLFIGSHEEPQSQIYYTFKASYFHFSAMVDPDLVLVGENYEWQNVDFDAGKADTRYNDTTIIEMGFDFGNFSTRFYGADVLNLGIWDGQTVLATAFSFPRFGLRYTNHRWWSELNLGSGTQDIDNGAGPLGQMKLSLTRFNLGIQDIGSFDFIYSFIKSNLEAPGFSQLTSDGSVHAIYASSPITKRIRGGAYTSVEMKSTSSIFTNTDKTFVKGGVSVFVSF